MRDKSQFSNNKDMGEFADVFDHVIHYYEKGQGEPVLMIHGLGQSLFTFRKNIDDLAEKFRVIAVDLLGHGYSGKPEIDYTIQDFTDSLVNFMNVKRLERAHIFAFSTGAMIALNLASLYPEKVRRMILLTPGGITSSYPGPIKSLRRSIFGDIALSYAFNRNRIEHYLKSAYMDQTAVDAHMVEQNYLPFEDLDCRDVVAAAVMNWDDREVIERMPKLTMPISVLWGECDKWHPIHTMMDKVADLLPYAFIATVRNAGHLLHEEKAREINRKVIECLSEYIPETEPPVAEKKLPDFTIAPKKNTSQQSFFEEAELTLLGEDAVEEQN